MSRIKNFIRNINYLTKHSLWDQREEDIAFLTDKILDDGIYEYGIVPPGRKSLSILTAEESLDLIGEHPKSFVRINDGEVKIIMGMDQPFQRYEKEIADRLIEMLENPRDDLYVGINKSYFEPMENDVASKRNFNRRFAYEYRRVYYRYASDKTRYIDSDVTLFKIGTDKRNEQRAFFEQWINLFKGKEIVVICGEGILDKLHYDIFELASKKKFIYGPKKHAWEQHSYLIERIKNEVGKDQILIFILGMAGKAMIPELTDMGYMCWDIGHLAKYYDSYMSNAQWTQEYTANFYAPD